MTLPPIVVLDGEHRAALAVTRSLGSHGYPVHIGTSRRKSLAGGSRFAVSETTLRNPLEAADRYASQVAELIGATNARVLLPLSDVSSLTILEHRELFQDVCIPGGDLAAFARAADKQSVLDLAERLGIAVPEQWVISDPAALPELPNERFPVVLKPARSVSLSPEQRTKVNVAYARNMKELRGRLEDYPIQTYPILIQRRIIGDGLGVFLLRWNGVIYATFAHRRLKEFPPSGGVSVTCESVAAPDALRLQAEALLAELDWQGVAMVEFKVERTSGRSYLMEINPRFWGSLQLALDSGVDFPWYLVRLALGDTMEPVRHWKVGIRNWWEWGSIDYLIARLTKSPGRLNLPPDAPRLLRTVGETLLPWRPGQRSSVFRFRDPVPFFRESIQWFKSLRG